MNDPNSKYHSESVLELQGATLNETENQREKIDPRVSRPMGMTDIITITEKVQIVTDGGLKDATNTHDDNRPTGNETTNKTVPDTELRAATSIEMSTHDILSNTETIELQVTTTKQKLNDVAEHNEVTMDSQNVLNTELGSNNVDVADESQSSECSNSEIMLLSTNIKPYDIKRNTKNLVTHDLPQLESTVTLELDLPNLNQESTMLTDVPTTGNNTPDDDLPLLEHYNELNDFESLMNLADDVDNSELVPIDGPPQPDLVRDINRECGINSDLELAMDNALFLDTQLLQLTSKGNHRKQSNRTRVTYTSAPGSPPGRLAVRTHGIRKMGPEERQDKRFNCPNCNFKGYSRASVSDHFSKTHGVVYCKTCGKQCPNPHALKRHEYIHANDKQHVCKTCNETFFFESELKNHRVKHRSKSSFFCMHTGCGKTFHRNSDLNAHVEVHTGKIWYCDHDGCDYSNHDKRLLKGHKRSHLKASFKCKYDTCNKTFKHTMARLRHYEKDH